MTFYGCEIKAGEAKYFSGSRGAIAPFLVGKPVSCTRMFGLEIETDKGSTFIRVYPERYFRQLGKLYEYLVFAWMLDNAPEESVEVQAYLDWVKQGTQIAKVGESHA